MKSLLRVVWTVIKITLFTIGCLSVLAMLLLVTIAAAAAILSPDKHKIEDKSVLVFNLDAKITDRPADEWAQTLARLFGNEEEAIIQLRTATTALRDAAHDSRISGLYLEGNLHAGDYSSGYAALKELREAIQDFQKSGKPVIAYIANADNRDYYLQSVADQILLNPMGLLAFRGLAAEGTFFKGAADKYGFEFTPTRHGKYKSAIEPLTREDYSPENREQITALLGTVWGDLRNTVATARKITPEQLQAVIDKEGLISAETAKARGLVTDLAYEGQALDKLRELTGQTDKNEPFPQITISDYASNVKSVADRIKHVKDKIAIVYAEGEIIDGNSEKEGEVAGDRFAKIIRDLQERKDVKALVLRVNSPGGSGQASEVMLDELRRFNSNRPVIVSMGTVAASGGYYISMASRRIVAEPSTITGSIGVFGLGMNVKKLANDHGITFDTIKTGELADLGTISRPMTPREQDVLQNLVDHFYNEFIQRVATNRKMTTNHVDSIAQGRVWSGADAMKQGLVDEMGGLQKAIADAAQEAKLGTNYSVVEFPEPKTLAEQLATALQGNETPLTKSKFSTRVMQMVAAEYHWFASLNDPHGIYTRLPFDLKLN